MSVLIRDLRFYGSASMPDDDTPLNIGGAISLSKGIAFTDVDGFVEAVSDTTADTSQTVTVHYRDAVGAALSEVKTLTGVTPVAFTANMKRLLKAIKSGSTTGNVAVRNQTAEYSSSTGVGGSSADYIQLDAAASAVNNFHRTRILRLADNRIFRIVFYDGTTKRAYTNNVVSPVPGTGTAFTISKGFFFEKTPQEILEVRRLHYAAQAEAPGGADLDYYDKFFAKNTSAEQLTASFVSEDADPSGLLTFGLALALDDSSGNGAGNNRKVTPPGTAVGTFDSAEKATPGTGNMGSGTAIGVWSKLTLLDGTAGQNTTYSIKLRGSTT